MSADTTRRFLMELTPEDDAYLRDLLTLSDRDLHAQPEELASAAAQAQAQLEDHAVSNYRVLVVSSDAVTEAEKAASSLYTSATAASATVTSLTASVTAAHEALVLARSRRHRLAALSASKGSVGALFAAVRHAARTAAAGLLPEALALLREAEAVTAAASARMRQRPAAASPTPSLNTVRTANSGGALVRVLSSSVASARALLARLLLQRLVDSFPTLALSPVAAQGAVATDPLAAGTTTSAAEGADAGAVPAWGGSPVTRSELAAALASASAGGASGAIGAEWPLLPLLSSVSEANIAAASVSAPSSLVLALASMPLASLLNDSSTTSSAVAVAAASIGGLTLPVSETTGSRVLPETSFAESEAQRLRGVLALLSSLFAPPATASASSTAVPATSAGSHGSPLPSPTRARLRALYLHSRALASKLYLLSLPLRVLLLRFARVLAVTPLPALRRRKCRRERVMSHGDNASDTETDRERAGDPLSEEQETASLLPPRRLTPAAARALATAAAAVAAALVELEVAGPAASSVRATTTAAIAADAAASVSAGAAIISASPADEGAVGISVADTTAVPSRATAGIDWLLSLAPQAPVKAAGPNSDGNVWEGDEELAGAAASQRTLVTATRAAAASAASSTPAPLCPSSTGVERVRAAQRALRASLLSALGAPILVAGTGNEVGTETEPKDGDNDDENDEAEQLPLSVALVKAVDFGWTRPLSLLGPLLQPVSGSALASSVLSVLSADDANASTCTGALGQALDQGQVNVGGSSAAATVAQLISVVGATTRITATVADDVFGPVSYHGDNGDADTEIGYEAETSSSIAVVTGPLLRGLPALPMGGFSPEPTIRSNAEPSISEEAGEVGAEANEWGLPLVLALLPPGILPPHTHICFDARTAAIRDLSAALGVTVACSASAERDDGPLQQLPPLPSPVEAAALATAASANSSSAVAAVASYLAAAVSRHSSAAADAAIAALAAAGTLSAESATDSSSITLLPVWLPAAAAAVIAGRVTTVSLQMQLLTRAPPLAAMAAALTANAATAAAADAAITAVGLQQRQQWVASAWTEAAAAAVGAVVRCLVKTAAAVPALDSSSTEPASAATLTSILEVGAPVRTWGVVTTLSPAAAQLGPLTADAAADLISVARAAVHGTLSEQASKEAVGGGPVAVDPLWCVALALRAGLVPVLIAVARSRWGPCVEKAVTLCLNKAAEPLEEVWGFAL